MNNSTASTTAVGNRLEDAIADLLESEIAAGRFWAKKSCCKLFRKKGYFSQTRKTNIVFDASIEVRMPGAAAYSLLILIECKNYGHSVPVDDAEEFSAKVKQIGDLNTKAVLASSAPFQSGTLQFAKSTGMGLLRYFGPENFKWELQRSASAGARTTSSDFEPIISDGLTRADFRSEVFDLFLQSPSRLTNSLWDFLEDFAVSSSLAEDQIRQITNPRTSRINIVPFLEKERLETIAESTLRQVSYSRGAVSLDAICSREKSRTGLNVEFHSWSCDSEEGAGVGPIGRIRFNPPKIDVYWDTNHAGRHRFTLAHELAHHLLRHGKYMRGERCDESDFVLERRGLDDGTDVPRMEYQANYFAASLLMPRANFVADFWRELRRLDLRDKGFGPLFVDDQQCNLDNYRSVTDALGARYEVSRQAVSIRLTTLGLLRDRRRSGDHSSVQSHLVTAFTRLSDPPDAG